MPPSPYESLNASNTTIARQYCFALILFILFIITIATRTPTMIQDPVHKGPDQEIQIQHQGYSASSNKRSLIKKLAMDRKSKREAATEASTSSTSTSTSTSTFPIQKSTPTFSNIPTSTYPTSLPANGTTTQIPQVQNSTIIASINSSSTPESHSDTPVPSDMIENSTKIFPFPFPDTNDPRAIFPKEFTGPESLLQNGSKCVQFTEEQLVKELKQHGTYNPDFMAWDVRGVLNFFERATTDNYDKLKKTQDRAMTIEQNLAAVEQLVKELNLQNCNLRTPDVLARLYNLSSITPPRPSSDSPNDYGRLRTKRGDTNDIPNDQIDPLLFAKAKYIFDLYTNNRASNRDDSLDSKARKNPSDQDGIVGQVHVVPSGCRKRGSSEDGYLRLCSACQAIRRLPDTFFPPFLNEVTCDEDKACLYFYDYPHGKCRQKHLNLVVLKNVGTPDCQLWKRYNLNVRVSCECFVDEMSFFAKYV